MTPGAKLLLALQRKPAGYWTWELCYRLDIDHSQLKAALARARSICAPGKRIEIIATAIDKTAPDGMRRSSLYVLTTERI